MTNMIRRIEKLEQEVELLRKPNQKTYGTGQATDNQKSYIVKLGGVAPNNMTKQEAGKEIDRLLKENVIGSHPESPEVTEPKEVDTDEAGLVGDLM